VDGSGLQRCDGQCENGEYESESAKHKSPDLLRSCVNGIEAISECPHTQVF
jgi:hypothetical protein